MKKTGFKNVFSRRVMRGVQFANSKPPGEAVVFFANEISIGADGWAMITKFGDYPSTALIPGPDGKLKKQKAIQRVDKAGAEAMVAQFHNERRGVRKFLKGCNIYDGHPDVPGLEKFYADREPKGVFADLAVREDGLYGLPIFTNEGSDLVENKKRRAFSGRIGDCEECEPVNGVPCFRPMSIFSAGLTNNPHLPVNFFNSDDTLAEAPADANNPINKMKTKLVALFAALSLKPQFANAEAPTDAETEAALDQVQAKVVAFANEQTEAVAKTKTLKEKLLGLCAAVGIQFANADGITDPAATLAQVNDKVLVINTDLTNARTQFANERNARIDDEIAAAIKGGRITDAEKPTWQGRLKVDAQFANELTALRALTPKVKTTSVTVNRGGKDTQIDVSDAKARRQFVNEALEEVAAEKGYKLPKDYNKAFNEVQRRHPALFANMQQPEIKKR